MTRLRTARKSQGKTQRQVAKASGVNQQTVCQVETGATIPDLVTLGRLCKALDIRDGVRFIESLYHKP